MKKIKKRKIMKVENYEHEDVEVKSGELMFNEHAVFPEKPNISGLIEGKNKDGLIVIRVPVIDFKDDDEEFMTQFLCANPHSDRTRIYYVERNRLVPVERTYVKPKK